MRKIFIILLAVIVFTNKPVNAFSVTNWNDQEVNSEDDIYRFYQEGLIGYFDYLNLSNIWDNKIDINQAEADDLLDLPGVDERIAESIIKYREKFGNFSKISDLQKAPLLTKNTYNNIRNFITVYPFKKGGSLRIKIEEDPLDDEGVYIYHRLQYQTPQFAFGYLLERDQEVDEYFIENGSAKKGEEKSKFRLKKRYILLKDIYGIENIIIGNYTIRFGNGLVIGNSDRRNKIGALPDISLYDKFFGVTGKLKLKRITLTPFYSKDRLNNSGLPDVYREEIKGLNTRFDIARFFSLGGTYYKSEINKDFDFNMNTYPDSSEAEVSGIDFFYNYNFLKFSGEAAKVRGKGQGKYLELSYDLKNVFSIMSFRDYDVNFYDPHSRSFADEDDEPNDRDERGFYLESDFRVSKELGFKTSFDQWKHPSNLVTDRELRGQINSYPAPFLNLLLQRRIRDEDLSRSGDKNIKDYLNGRFMPAKGFDIDIFYGENKELEDSQTVDNFWGYQMKLGNDKNIFLVKAKFTDNNISEAGDKKREYYFYIKLKEIKQTTLSFSFKTIHSTEEVFPNPEEVYNVVCDYVW